jgi:hypothetical protein
MHPVTAPLRLYRTCLGIIQLLPNTMMVVGKKVICKEVVEQVARRIRIRDSNNRRKGTMRRVQLTVAVGESHQRNYQTIRHIVDLIDPDKTTGRKISRVNIFSTFSLHDAAVCS